MPVNWRTAAPKDIIGVLIPTRLGAVHFGNLGLATYAAVAAKQMEWPGALLVPAEVWPPEVPHVGHPLTIKCLLAASRLLDKWARDRAARDGVPFTTGRIVTGGFFRPLGTTWGEGEFADPRGALDSVDALGHWYMAIDICRTDTGKTWTPVIPKAVVDEKLKAAGLKTPFAVEPWHYRPGLAAREAWAKKQVG